MKDIPAKHHSRQALPGVFHLLTKERLPEGSREIKTMSLAPVLLG